MHFREGMYLYKPLGPSNTAVMLPVRHLQLVQQPHLTHVTASPHCPYNGAQRHNYGVIDPPEGCTLTAHIPGDAEVFAVLYM